jgi:hypothetical protein
MSHITAQPWRVPIAYVRVDEQPTEHGIPCYADLAWFQYLCKELLDRVGGVNGMSNQELQIAVDALDATTALHTSQIAVHTTQIADHTTQIAAINVSINDIYGSIAQIPVFNPGYLEQQIHDLQVLGADV